VTRWDARTCRSIAQGGHLHVLQWARAQEPRPGWDELTCAWAAEGGHLHVLQWVRDQDPPCAWWGHANVARRVTQRVIKPHFLIYMAAYDVASNICLALCPLRHRHIL